MGVYQLRYCGSDGRQFAAFEFGAEDDVAARARARFLARLKSPAFEVWEGGRLVCREIVGATVE